MTAVDQLVFRYISGLIANKGASKQFWIDPMKVANPVARGMLSELKAMWAGDTPMTAELISDRFYKNRLIGESMDPDQVFRFVQNSSASGISRIEVHNLHDAIMRDYVFSNAAKAVQELLPKLDCEEALDEVQATIRDLKASLPGMGVNIHRQFEEALEEAESGGKGIIKFGIPLLDARLGGFARGEVSIIAGRPGHGKTSLAVQFALNYLDQGLKVLIISKEMKTFRLIHKIIANKTDLTSKKLHRGELTEEEIVVLKEASAKLAKEYEGRLFIYDDVYDTHKIEAAVAKHKPDVVIDDFIQLTACDDSNIRLEILRIMKTYKAIAKEYNAAVITLSQLNRSIETREDPMPRLSDLAESGAIEQLAADVLFVYYPHKVDPDQPADQVLVIAAKTRYGTSGRFVLGFQGEHMRYRQIPVQVR